MSPLVKYLCNIRNKQINRGANTDLQERINKLIRENQIRAVRNENRKYQIGAKGWWNTVNRITGRTSKSDNISATIDSSVILITKYLFPKSKHRLTVHTTATINNSSRNTYSED